MGEKVEIKPPSQKTLDKYGLSAEQWMAILDGQGGVCAICKKVPSTFKFVVDHEHFKGFDEMPAEKRRKFVRGVLCKFCNRFYLAKGITAEKARNMAKYLSDYGFRRLQDP
jgi:hypothetical protein